MLRKLSFYSTLNNDVKDILLRITPHILSIVLRTSFLKCNSSQHFGFKLAQKCALYITMYVVQREHSFKMN